MGAKLAAFGPRPYPVGMLCGAVCGLLVLAAQELAPANARELTVTFPFHDAELLDPGQSNGGLVFVPASVDPRRRAPLVVFLHGVNESRALHPRLREGDDDLRALARSLSATTTEPFVVAAPSHTRGADAAELLFPHFALDELVDASERALGDRARIDRARVLVVGHSGGGCNPTGGMIRVASSEGTVATPAVRPFAYVASDTCLGSYVSDALDRAAKTAKVRVFWQTWMWPRSSDSFTRSFCDRVAPGRDVRCDVLSLTGVDAHEQSLIVGLKRVLPELLPR